VTDYIVQSCPIDVIYLDFQKAFNKVPHRRLMKKINALGIAGYLYRWTEEEIGSKELFHWEVIQNELW
jgi:hypothetical protein